MTEDSPVPTMVDTVAPTAPGQRAADAGPPDSPDPRYELKTQLARGGMGEIWLARDLRVDRDIAIKLMRRDASRDPQAVGRFLREARVQGRLEHPSVVPVHDLGGGETAPFFAMKRLTGTTLGAVIEARFHGDREALERWTRPLLLARLIDVCLAIELAHRSGVIHRDLKPANIMLGDLGEVYVLDWGLARVDATDDATIVTGDLHSGSGSSGGAQTVAGALLGTPGYMSPEQMRGEPLDASTDIFALGCILYEILAGEPAIPRDQAFEVTLAASAHRPSARRPTGDIPPELDDLCAAATAAGRTARPPSARALADAIQRYLDGDRDVARRSALAHEHARRAAEAVERGDDARAEAMREAGRALALAPDSRDVQELLARILLEPPKQIPAEARRKVVHEREVAGQQMLRDGAKTYAAFLAIVPIARYLTTGPIWPFALIGALLVVLIVACTVLARRPRAIGGATFAFVIGVHAAMLASVGILLGPLLLLPTILSGSLSLLLLMPSIDFPRRCLALHLLALLVPFALEWTHVLPPSFRVEGSSLILEPRAIHLTPMAMVFILVGTLVVQLVSNTLVTMAERAHRERAQERVHLNAWHYAQLLPREARRASTAA
jgi:eukaryotic-like serine/threonine-protein kinase